SRTAKDIVSFTCSRAPPGAPGRPHHPPSSADYPALLPDRLAVDRLDSLDDAVPVICGIEPLASWAARQGIDQRRRPGGTRLSHDRAVLTGANHLGGDADVVRQHVETSGQHLEDHDSAAFVVRGRGAYVGGVDPADDLLVLNRPGDHTTLDARRHGSPNPYPQDRKSVV